MTEHLDGRITITIEIVDYKNGQSQEEPESSSSPDVYKRQIYSSAIYIAKNIREGVEEVDDHILKVYVPMTETGFYILLCFREESHGYSVVRKVEELSLIHI